MLKGKGLPNSFWVEAVYTTVYILNWSFTKTFKGKKPHEAYSGKKPFIAHFRTIGCECYVHASGVVKSKLESKSKKCIFEYSQESKAYRLYNPKVKKVICSHNVVFND